MLRRGPAGSPARSQQSAARARHSSWGDFPIFAPTPRCTVPAGPLAPARTKLAARDDLSSPRRSTDPEGLNWTGKKSGIPDNLSWFLFDLAAQIGRAFPRWIGKRITDENGAQCDESSAKPPAPYGDAGKPARSLGRERHDADLPCRQTTPPSWLPDRRLPIRQPATSEQGREFGEEVATLGGGV
jgi:hypothetical protein